MKIRWTDGQKFPLFFSQDDPNNQIPDYLDVKRKSIQPILILPDPGWLLYNEPTDKTRNAKPKVKNIFGRNYTWLWSTHGWDPSICPEMQTIFFAYGPAFKKGVTMEPFVSRPSVTPNLHFQHRD